MYIILDEFGNFYKTEKLTEDLKHAFELGIMDIIDIKTMSYLTDITTEGSLIWADLKDIND